MEKITLIITGNDRLLPVMIITDFDHNRSVPLEGWVPTVIWPMSCRRIVD